MPVGPLLPEGPLPAHCVEGRGRSSPCTALSVAQERLSHTLPPSRYPYGRSDARFPLLFRQVFFREEHEVPALRQGRAVSATQRRLGRTSSCPCLLCGGYGQGRLSDAFCPMRCGAALRARGFPVLFPRPHAGRCNIGVEEGREPSARKFLEKKP